MSWRWKLLWTIGMIGIVFSGCASSKEYLYPEDHLRFERIVEAVKTLETAYVQQDIEKTKNLFLPLEPLQALANDARKDFAIYSDILLDLSIERMFIEQGLIVVHVSWQGEWKRTSQAQGLKAQGRGILYWNGTHVILLSGVAGDLPFGMADREATL